MWVLAPRLPSPQVETGFIGALTDWIAGGPDKRARAKKKLLAAEAAAAEAARLQGEMDAQLQLLAFERDVLAQRGQVAASPSTQAVDTRRWLTVAAIGGLALGVALLVRSR